MNIIRSLSPTVPTGPAVPKTGKKPSREESKAEFREKFDQVLGETMYGMMLKSLRKTERKPAYFHGGRAEEIFGQELDQVLAQKMGKNFAGGATSMDHVAGLTRR